MIILIQCNGEEGITIVCIPFQRRVNALLVDKDLVANSLDSGLVLGKVGALDRVGYVEYSFVNSTARPM